MSVIRPIHQDCQAAFNLLSTIQVNEVIDEVGVDDHEIHEHDEDASIHSHNSDDDNDVDA